MIKLSLKIFCFLLFSVEASSQLKQKINLSVNVEIIGKTEDNEGNKNNNYNSFYSRLELFNNEDSAVHIYLMSCSWNNSWVSDNDSVFISDFPCDGNDVIKVKLLPKSSVIFYCTIASNKKLFISREFRFGFAILNRAELQTVGDIRTSNKRFDSFKKTKEVIWSDPVLLRNNSNQYFLRPK